MSDDAALPAPVPPTDYNQRQTWFTSTPDPWEEIVGLAHGGDRTYATTVQRIVMSAEPAQHAAMEEKLLAVLANPELTGAARQFVCRMLGLVGSAHAVPALAPLLASDRTADTARLALDRIEDPAVDEVYRAALDKLHGSAKAGLIGSIGLRRDRAAVSTLAAIAANSTEADTVRTAARRALERINSEEAVR